MAVETDAATATELALADTDINWDRLDKMRFHVIGAILFTAQLALIHPTAVVKTRMQVASSGLSHMSGLSVFRQILKHDGIPGIFRGFGTSTIGSLPGRVLALTSLEVSKDMMLKCTEGLDMPEATRVGIANGVAGMLSNLISCVYYVPLEVICQRLMVQGLPGITFCNGPFDIVCKVVKAEGIRGMYRGFGLTAVTQSPASALWWGAYGAAQHIIWRSLSCAENLEKKPSHLDIVAVQATAGMVAGACSSVVTTPIDIVKTRLQVIDDYGAGRPSVIRTAKTLLKEDGWRGFYRGFGPLFLNMSLYGTTMIVTYELIRRKYALLVDMIFDSPDLCSFSGNARTPQMPLKQHGIFMRHVNFHGCLKMGLSFTKLFSRLFSKREIRIVMVGLDAAGKTTILYKLKLGEVVTTIPTIGFNVETVEYKNINFTVWDIGGQDQISRLWRFYFSNTQGLIFVVDSNDRDRAGEARDKLHKLLNEDELKDAVLLVFANKQDLPNAMNAAEITDKLGLQSLRQQRWYIQSTCATSGEGLYEGLDWLSNNIVNK
ncbi:unnamed protein product, partial [Ilex paraguariensis]